MAAMAEENGARRPRSPNKRAMKKAVVRRFTLLKWIPRILFVGIIAFAAFVWWSYGRTTAKDPPIVVPKKEGPRKIVGTVKNIDYTHFDKGQRVYRVIADTQEKMKSNAQKLTNPEFVFYDKEQKETIRVTGKQCTISKDMSTITMLEDTEVKSPNGMSVSARTIKYDSRLHEFSTPSPSKFEWKTMRGRAKGFIYKIDTENLILPEKPEIHYINPLESDRTPIVMEGERGLIDRQNGFAYFEENVVVTQGQDKIKADRIETAFTPDGNDLEKITAIGNVHIKFGRPGTSQPVEEKVPVAVVPVSRQTPGLGNVFQTEESTAKDLDAKNVEMFFAKDGRTITSFHSTGDCVFVLHSYNEQNKPRENRIIKGDEFDARFNAIGEMEQFHAMQNVSVKIQPMGAAKKEEDTSNQTIYCDDLLAYFLPTTGDVREIHFNRGFKHVQNKRVVSSDTAIYTAALKKTDLTGSPEIKDPTLDITSETMELFEETSGIVAKGNVKSAFIKSEGKTPTTFPFSSPSNQPVYISAETMNWDSQKSEAHYNGKAKLWQESNVITADRMIINDIDKTLSAYDKVHTIFYNDKKKGAEADAPKAKVKKSKKQAQTQSQTQTQAQSQPQTQEKTEPENYLIGSDETTEEGPISVDAGIMNYVEKDRIIHYEKDVKIVTPSTKIESERADFYLMEKTSELDRLYAQGNVRIAHEKKKGTGKQALFYSRDKKLVLEGSSKLTEPGKADIVGRVLTLFLEDGRILIDGAEDGRAKTTLQMQGSELVTPGKDSKNVKKPPSQNPPP